MKRPPLSLLLTLTLTLGACGSPALPPASTAAPSTGTASAPPAAGPQAALEISVTAAAVQADGQATASLGFPGLGAGSLPAGAVEVRPEPGSLPPGVSLKVQPPSLGPGGLTLPVTV